MNRYLQLVLGITALTTTAAMLLAADTTTTYPATTYPVYGTSSHVALDHSGSNSVAASVSSAGMVALNAQALLLKELAQEHQSRAMELTQTNQSEKAKWETELVNELKEKSGRVQKSIDQMSQPGPGGNELKAGAGDVDDQLVFVSTVEARLEQLHQEVSAATEDSRVLSMQISTNKLPEDIAAMSSELGDTQRLVKELQKEQLDLELRKLEFRAIRKAMQK